MKKGHLCPYFFAIHWDIFNHGNLFSLCHFYLFISRDNFNKLLLICPIRQTFTKTIQITDSFLYVPKAHMKRAQTQENAYIRKHTLFD